MTAVYNITPGATDVSIYIRIIDLSSGVPEQSVSVAQAGMDLQYRRTGASVVDMTEVTVSIAGSHADGGFCHIDNGYYRIDLPDAACAAGANDCVVLGSVTDMVVIGAIIQLNGAVNDIYSDTTIIASDLLVLSNEVSDIYSDTTVIASDIVIVASDLLQVYSDTTIIYSDTSIIYSDTTAIHSDTTAVHSDTTAINTQTTTIASDLVQVYSDTTIVVSDTTAINTQTTTIASDLVQVYSDTTALGTQATTIASDLVQVYSDTTIVTSDTAVIETAIASVASVVTDMNLGIIYGSATAGTLTTTQMTTNLSAYANDQLIGRVVIWINGSAAGEAADITDNAATGAVLTYTSITVAPAAGNKFKIV